MAGPGKNPKEEKGKKDPIKNRSLSNVSKDSDNQETLDKKKEKPVISFTQKEHNILQDMFGDYRINPEVGKNNPKLLVEVIQLEERLLMFIKEHDPMYVKVLAAQKAANKVLEA